MINDFYIRRRILLCKFFVSLPSKLYFRSKLNLKSLIQRFSPFINYGKGLPIIQILIVLVVSLI